MSINDGKKRDRLLIIDSDKMTRELLQLKLGNEGFDVEFLDDTRQLMSMDLHAVDLILVDLMGKGYSGIDLLHTLKRSQLTYQLPIIAIGQKDSVDSVVDALDAGADDFIAKPLSVRELIARVHSVLRRRRISLTRTMSEVTIYHELTLDLSTGIATLAGQRLPLTGTEFKILAMLLRHRNRFFDRTAIKNEVWEGEENISDRSIDTNISRLRHKLGDMGHKIVNRHGYGYGFIE